VEKVKELYINMVEVELVEVPVEKLKVEVVVHFQQEKVRTKLIGCGWYWKRRRSKEKLLPSRFRRY